MSTVSEKHLLYECAKISTYFSIFPCLSRRAGYTGIYNPGIRNVQFQRILGLSVVNERLDGQVRSVMRSALLGIGVLCIFLTSCFSRSDMYDLVRLKNGNASLELIDVWASSNTSVRAEFSKSVDRTSAENTGNFFIPGLNIVSATVSMADDGIVDLVTSSQQDIDYSLTVTNIKDTEGEIIKGSTSLVFMGDACPSVREVCSNNNTEVVIYFSEEVERIYAEDTGNYSITPAVEVVSAIRDDANWSKVTLITCPQSGAVIYTLTVYEMKDLSGNALASPCSMDFTGPDSEEIIQPDNWGTVEEYLNDQASMGVSGPPTVDPYAIPTISGSNKWYGGVLAPNGKIYASPWDSTSVLIIDPETDTADESAISGLSSTTEKWLGGVLAPNGKIYFIPYNNDCILIVNPETNTYDDTTISGLSGSSKWTGGVLAPNGKIYAVPCDATSVLIIDPETNTYDDTTITVPANADKWYGGVLAPNGKIYCVPWKYNRVLIIDPETNTADYTTINVPSDQYKWVGGVLAPNGKIYCIPRNYDHVLIIDPATNTVDYTTISVPSDTFKWISGVLAPNGKIYGIPRDYDHVLIIDPDTNTADFSSLSVAEVSGTGKWIGGVLAQNDKIYCIPRDHDYILIIDPKSNGSFSSTVGLSGYFNKF
jgi:hypothetical protein